MDRDIRFSIRGMERQVLPGRSASVEDAGVLRRAFPDHGGELHFSSNSLGQDDRELDKANAGSFSFCAEGAAEDYALAAAARL